MTRRLAACIMSDLKLQLRHGFYYVYAIVGVLYVILLRLLPDGAREVALPLVIFSDPAMLGFFFIGALIIFERGDRTLDVLFVSPLRIYEYLASKVISLTMLATISSFAIALGVGAPFNPLLLLLGVVLTSVTFTLLGFIVVTRIRVLSLYLLCAGLGVGLLSLPFLDYFGLWTSPVLHLFCTKGGLTLISGAFDPEGLLGRSMLLSVVTLVVWASAASLLAQRWFERYVVRWTGGAP